MTALGFGSAPAAADADGVRFPPVDGRAVAETVYCAGSKGAFLPPPEAGLVARDHDDAYLNRSSYGRSLS